MDIDADGRECWLSWTGTRAVTAAVLLPFQLSTAEQREGPGRCCSLWTSMANGSPFAELRGGKAAPFYDWLSGPNGGYGFGSSGTPNRSMQEHREEIRAFLAMIDPDSDYIGDD